MAVVKILSILLIRLNFSLHSQSYAEHSVPFCSPLLLAFKGCAALALAHRCAAALIAAGKERREQKWH